MGRRSRDVKSGDREPVTGTIPTPSLLRGRESRGRSSFPAISGGPSSLEATVPYQTSECARRRAADQRCREQLRGTGGAKRASGSHKAKNTFQDSSKEGFREGRRVIFGYDRLVSEPRHAALSAPSTSPFPLPHSAQLSAGLVTALDIALFLCATDLPCRLPSSSPAGRSTSISRAVSAPRQPGRISRSRPWPSRSPSASHPSPAGLRLPYSSSRKSRARQ